jgi:hypothetical protein
MIMGKFNYTNIFIDVFFSSSRILKNRVVYKAPVQNELNHPLRIAESGRKEHISEPKQAIRKQISYLSSFIYYYLLFQRVIIQC